MKVTKKKTLRNLSVKSRLKTETRKFIELVGSKKLDEAKTKLPHLISELDKAVSKGIIHKNTASRRKSRLTRKILTTKNSPLGEAEGTEKNI